MLDKIMGFIRDKMGGASGQQGQSGHGGQSAGSGQSGGAGGQKADSAREELMANAQKALHMKQQAQTGANIPPHQTANEGMQVNETQEDHIPAKEGYFTPELKRTHVARSGDAS
jgi:hypothetical protein